MGHSQCQRGWREQCDQTANGLFNFWPFATMPNTTNFQAKVGRNFAYYENKPSKNCKRLKKFAKSGHTGHEKFEEAFCNKFPCRD